MGLRDTQTGVAMDSIRCFTEMPSHGEQPGLASLASSAANLNFVLDSVSSGSESTASLAPLQTTQADLECLGLLIPALEAEGKVINDMEAATAMGQGILARLYGCYLERKLQHRSQQGAPRNEDVSMQDVGLARGAQDAAPVTVQESAAMVTVLGWAASTAELVREEAERLSQFVPFQKLLFPESSDTDGTIPRRLKMPLSPSPACVRCLLVLLDTSLLLDLVLHHLSAMPPNLQNDCMTKGSDTGDQATQRSLQAETFPSQPWTILKQLLSALSQASGTSATSSRLFLHLASQTVDVLLSATAGSNPSSQAGSSNGSAAYSSPESLTSPMGRSARSKRSSGMGTSGAIRTLLSTERLQLLRALTVLATFASPVSAMEYCSPEGDQDEGMFEDVVHGLMALVQREPVVHAYGDIAFFPAALLDTLCTGVGVTVVVKGGQAGNSELDCRDQAKEEKEVIGATLDLTAPLDQYPAYNLTEQLATATKTHDDLSLRLGRVTSQIGAMRIASTEDVAEVDAELGHPPNAAASRVHMSRAKLALRISLYGVVVEGMLCLSRWCCLLAQHCALKGSLVGAAAAGAAACSGKNVGAAQALISAKQLASTEAVRATATADIHLSVEESMAALRLLGLIRGTASMLTSAAVDWPEMEALLGEAIHSDIHSFCASAVPLLLARCNAASTGPSTGNSSISSAYAQLLRTIHAVAADMRDDPQGAGGLALAQLERDGSSRGSGRAPKIPPVSSGADLSRTASQKGNDSPGKPTRTPSGTAAPVSKPDLARPHRGGMVILRSTPPSPAQMICLQSLIQTLLQAADVLAEATALGSPAGFQLEPQPAAAFAQASLFFLGEDAFAPSPPVNPRDAVHQRLTACLGMLLGPSEVAEIAKFLDRLLFFPRILNLRSSLRKALQDTLSPLAFHFCAPTNAVTRPSATCLPIALLAALDTRLSQEGQKGRRALPAEGLSSPHTPVTICPSEPVQDLLLLPLSLCDDAANLALGAAESVASFRYAEEAAEGCIQVLFKLFDREVMSTAWASVPDATGTDADPSCCCRTSLRQWPPEGLPAMVKGEKGSPTDRSKSQKLLALLLSQRCFPVAGRTVDLAQLAVTQLSASLRRGLTALVHSIRTAPLCCARELERELKHFQAVHAFLGRRIPNASSGSAAAGAAVVSLWEPFPVMLQKAAAQCPEVVASSAGESMEPEGAGDPAHSYHVLPVQKAMEQVCQILERAQWNSEQSCFDARGSSAGSAQNTSDIVQSPAANGRDHAQEGTWHFGAHEASALLGLLGEDGVQGLIDACAANLAQRTSQAVAAIQGFRSCICDTKRIKPALGTLSGFDQASNAGEALLGLGLDPDALLALKDEAKGSAAQDLLEALRRVGSLLAFLTLLDAACLRRATNQDVQLQPWLGSSAAASSLLGTETLCDPDMGNENWAGARDPLLVDLIQQILVEGTPSAHRKALVAMLKASKAASISASSMQSTATRPIAVAIKAARTAAEETLNRDRGEIVSRLGEEGRGGQFEQGGLGVKASEDQTTIEILGSATERGSWCSKVVVATLVLLSLAPPAGETECAEHRQSTELICGAGFVLNLVGGQRVLTLLSTRFERQAQTQGGEGAREELAVDQSLNLLLCNEISAICSVAI